MRAKVLLSCLLAFEFMPAFGVLSASGQNPRIVPSSMQAEQRSEGAQAPAVTTISPVGPQQSPSTGDEPAAQNLLPLSGSDLVLQSGDLLVISLYGIPDFNREVRVAEKGDIVLPLIGTLHVAGLTIQGAETLVRNRLIQGGFFVDPQVSITARESASLGTSILGEVQKPGIYFLPGQRTLFDAIAAAGGTTQRAGNTITITHRGHPDESQKVTLPPNQTLPPASNVAVTAGDTIVVSKAGIVYVMGDVRLPGGFVMENSDLTVLQALAMAQGANPTAKLDQTMLIRRALDGRQEIPVPLSKVMAAKSPDVKLLDSDIIFVPRSNTKAGFRRGLEAAMQTVIGVAIYRPL
jgi:polysaccharide export outer membrane protein